MAAICARCGAQNPDGNQFCMNCGTPLTAAGGVAAAPMPGPPPGPPPGVAPPGPPPGIAPPMQGPGGYQSPYYYPSPGMPQAPVHRTPWAVIISAVVALVLVMAGCGTTFAIIARNQSNTSTGGIESLPSPTPGVSPSPVASPTSTPVTGHNASNNGVTVPVPSGWVVVNSDSESITLTDSSDTGTVTVASGVSNPVQTAQQNKDQIDGYLKSKYPDTKSCPNTKTTTGLFKGVSGIYWTECFTLTASGQSIPAAAWLFAGANADGGIYYVVMVLSTQSSLSSFYNEARPILQGVSWKLS